MFNVELYNRTIVLDIDNPFRDRFTPKRGMHYLVEFVKYLNEQ